MTTPNLIRLEIERVYGQISPFELKDRLISLAKDQSKKSARTLLDAGRGNPNWIAATPREAFFTFGLFAVDETRRVWNQQDLAGMPQHDGIAERFNTYAQNHPDAPGMALLQKMIAYGSSVKGFNPDDWVYELADGIIGDNYPLPDRMLVHIEKIVKDYLCEELYGYNSAPPKDDFDVFAVEGATAGMCYIFDTLIANNMLALGDTIAVMVPVFTPYLEIPLLPRYDFKVIPINASELTTEGTHTWQYPASEIEKLKNPDIKTLFIVNPSNPPSVAIKPETIEQITSIVKEQNPDLMIITDDVYGTFVDHFHSLASDLPFNTLGVYSFSKYFGVTGWRLGVITLHHENVFDRLLKNLPERLKEKAKKRYESLSTHPEEIRFLDRIVADSRQVALNHTAGLSTPQQVQMAFFALFALLDNDSRYKELTKEICRHRQNLLFASLGLDLRADPYDASYYTEFDLLEWATHYYGNSFAQYLQEHYKLVDVLIRLAEESSIVLLNGSGFHGPEWSIRISLANLGDEDYSEIGKALHHVLEEYVADWKAATI